MTELDCLIVRHFRVERIEGRIIAFPDPNGKYRANSAEKVEEALTESIPPFGVDVKVGQTWYPIKNTKSYRKRCWRWRRGY